MLGCQCRNVHVLQKKDILADILDFGGHIGFADITGKVYIEPWNKSKAIDMPYLVFLQLTVGKICWKWWKKNILVAILDFGGHIGFADITGKVYIEP